jgi:hypothetical protein
MHKNNHVVHLGLVIKILPKYVNQIVQASLVYEWHIQFHKSGADAKFQGNEIEDLWFII